MQQPLERPRPTSGPAGQPMLRDERAMRVLELAVAATAIVVAVLLAVGH